MENIPIRLTFLGLLALSICQLNAQWQQGGLGYTSVGITLNQFANLEGSLESSALLSEGLSLIGTGVGVGGLGLINGKYVIGGHGAANALNRTEGNLVNIDMAGGGGGFDVGYVLLNKRNNLLFPAFGFGGYGVSMEIENISNSEQYFGRFEIAENRKEQFTMGGLYTNLGVQFFHLFRPLDESQKGTGGFILGVKMGYQFLLSQQTWEAQANENFDLGIQNDTMNYFYIKVLIGGGGFRLK